MLVVAFVVVVLTAGAVVRHGRQDEARTADAVLVLGAAQFDGRPQDVLRARLDHARDLFQSGAAPQVLTVGGKQPGDRFTEADAGKAYLVERGVPAGRIVAVGKGQDTAASIQAAAAVMRQRGWSSAIVVTDPWHELRSTAMLEDAGITAYGSPTRTGPSVAGWQLPARYVARETLAYLYYVISRELP